MMSSGPGPIGTHPKPNSPPPRLLLRPRRPPSAHDHHHPPRSTVSAGCGEALNHRNRGKSQPRWMAANGGGDRASIITAEIEKLKAEKSDIDRRISALESELNRISTARKAPPFSHASSGHGLPPEAVYRYSRHLLLPSFGVQAQSKLLHSSILIVGAGGLGSPAALYLAACGVGRLGLVDDDVVELNNLHRQIIHSEAYIGKSKVKSAAAACRSINSTVEVVEHNESLRACNAVGVVSLYDVVVDATDNVPSRYMVNDVCVLLGKPLVSGAALGLEGQLTVYNYNGGPCYRCLFPTPPPTTACQRCSDSGVLGVVPGVIGCLQALEAVKIASAVGEPLSGRMLLLDALSSRIRTVKIRGRSLGCAVCGENSNFSGETFEGLDYEEFTGTPVSTLIGPKLNLLPDTARISSREYNDRITNGEAHVLVDVRPSHHFKITALPNALNIPLPSLESRLKDINMALENANMKSSAAPVSLYVVCRRGNDSQKAVHKLHEVGLTSAKDIIGGLESWAHDVDQSFPMY